MEMPIFLQIGLILFVATIVVRVAGFGGSLVAVPLLTPIIGLTVAAPIMSLFGATNFGIVISQRWRELTLRDIWRLALMTILFVPVGIYLANVVVESTMRIWLGCICILYSLYQMVKLPFPQLKNANWGFFFGILAGLASGAFTVGGVPSVIYADTQRWSPDRFRLNMFSYFFVTSCFAAVTRFFAGQLTSAVVLHWLGALPFLFAGLYLGKRLAEYVNRDQFRKLVLVMLIILGARLIASAL